MPPTNRSRSTVRNNIDSDNENERMAVRASQAAAQKMMKNDPKQYRDQIQATTNTYGWNTVETGAPIPAMPAYPAPPRPHQNIKRPLNEKINTAISILNKNGFNKARQYVINTKANIEYTKTQRDARDRLNRKEYYTPEWILAQGRVKRLMQKEAKNRNNTMKTLRYLAYNAKGGRTQRTRKTLRRAHRRP